ncbi:MAG: chemotaxis protein CheR [Deltaproteobacteria bacterium]|nr:MAG: chemotaxis protein CheR [Deltaproteobacteria bacterium]
MTQNISDHTISKLSELVRSQTGLYFTKERWTDLKRGIDSAALELDFENTEAFIHSLLSSPLTGKQLDSLVRYLTIGETYFFRDKNVFKVLEKHLLPDLINLRRNRGKSLRFWSAACCSGEEPYTIAIYIDQVLPEWQDWEITILASDINARFLQKAIKGVYTNWSFRDTPKWVMKKYFQRYGENRYEISPHIKKMVTFFQFNLSKQGRASHLNSIQAMDVIFCRNVLIYFDSEMRAQVIQNLSGFLSDGGWLIVSPSEAPFIQQPGLHQVRFPGAILYKKGISEKQTPDKPEYKLEHRPRGKARFSYKVLENRLSKTIPLPSPALSSRPEAQKDFEKITKEKRHEPKQDLYGEALTLYEKGHYEKSADMLAVLLSQGRDNHHESVVLLARACANLGKLDDAEKWCKQAVINAEKLNPVLHYLLATIYHEQGHLKESIKSHRQALYIDPEFVLAHFALGNLLQKLGRFNESGKHFENALSLLLRMDTDEIIPFSEGISAGSLTELVQSMIKKEQAA